MEQVSSGRLQNFRDCFFSKFDPENSDLCIKDLDRIKQDDIWLSKFLIQADFDTVAAAKSLYETCQWRKEFGTNDLKEKDIPPRILHKGYMSIRNRDKLGYPLLFMRATAFVKGTEDMNTMKKHVVFLLERLEREAKNGQGTVVVDFQNAGLSNIDMGFTRYMITTVLPNYPLLFHQIIMFELPWILNPVWKIIKSLLPQKLAEAIKTTTRKNIDEYIDEDNRLFDMGGKDDFSIKYYPEVVEKVESEDILDANQNVETKTNENDTIDEKLNTSPTVLNQEEKQASECEISEIVEEAPSTKKIQIESSPPAIEESQDKGNDQVPEPSNDNTAIETKINGKAFNTLHVPRQIIFKKDGGTGISAKFHIKNVSSSNQTLAFKIKTTSPDKFYVRPTTGILKGGAVELAVIKLQVSPPFSQRSVDKERFQIQAVSVSSNQNSRGDFKNGAEIWKDKGGKIESHLLTCCLDPAIFKNHGNSKIPEQLSTFLKQIEQRMAEIKGKFSGNADLFEKLLYVLLGVGIGYLFLLWQTSTSAPSNCEETSSRLEIAK